MVEAPDGKKTAETTTQSTSEKKEDPKETTKTETGMEGDETTILEEDDDFEEFNNEDGKLHCVFSNQGI